MEFSDARDRPAFHLHTVGRRPRHGHVQPRSVHGLAAKDHSMWEQGSSFCHGGTCKESSPSHPIPSNPFPFCLALSVISYLLPLGDGVIMDMGRHHFPKASFPSYSQRSTMYIRTFSAQREYIWSAWFLFLLLLLLPLTRCTFVSRVIFGMLIALPITLVYYILLGI
ncbi:hypothetical protein BHE74_00001141 [Ensete ventricosum]|nr:hypothetical protein BHE74_00001141 [Ensete ventricosum]